MNEQNKIGATTASENEAPKNKDVDIRIKQADNGVIVEGRYKGASYYEEQWVFQSMEDAFKEIPSIMSVVSTKGKEKDAKRKSQKDGSMPMDECC